MPTLVMNVSQFLMKNPIMILRLRNSSHMLIWPISTKKVVQNIGISPSFDTNSITQARIAQNSTQNSTSNIDPSFKKNLNFQAVFFQLILNSFNLLSWNSNTPKSTLHRTKWLN